MTDQDVLEQILSWLLGIGYDIADYPAMSKLANQLSWEIELTKYYPYPVNIYIPVYASNQFEM